MSKRVIVTFGVALMIATTATTGSIFAARDESNTKGQHHKVTICHANHSATGKSGNQPYVKISVDYHANIKGKGHGGHTGPVASTLTEAAEHKEAKVHWGDIIPPVEKFGYAGLNWNEKGKAIYNNACRLSSSKAILSSVSKSEAIGTQTTIPAELPKTGNASTVGAVLSLGALTAVVVAAYPKAANAFRRL